MQTLENKQGFYTAAEFTVSAIPNFQVLAVADVYEDRFWLLGAQNPVSGKQVLTIAVQVLQAPQHASLARRGSEFITCKGRVWPFCLFAGSLPDSSA